MKNEHTTMNVTFLFSACMLLLSGTLMAQAPRPAQPARITFPKDVEINEVRTPTYNESSHSKARNTDRWVQLFLEYQMEGGREGWVDEVTFNWSVLLLGGTNPRILMHRSVTNLDVATERATHYTAMYIRPEAIQRHYDTRGRINARNVLVYVEVLVDNVRVAEYQYSKTTLPVPPRWWQFKEPDVTVLPYGLLSRDMTPFAPMDYDLYNFIKPQSTR